MRRLYALFSFFILSLTAFPLHASDPSDPRFHATLNKICLEGLAEQGVKVCDSAVQFCMNKTYDCYRKANCTLSKTNPPHLSCDSSASGCTDITQYVVEFKGKGNPCEEVQGNLTEPGCGNGVTELFETCDVANNADKNGCPADCGAVAGSKCFNGQLDAGEECDAGQDNGKLSAGCDLECKKIVAASAATNGAVPDGNVPAGPVAGGSEDKPANKEINPNSAQGPSASATSCSLNTR